MLRGRLPYGELLVLAVIAALLLAFLARSVVRIRRARARARRTARATHGYCPACGYDLAGLTPGACPECGAAITGKELDQLRSVSKALLRARQSE